MTVGSKPWRFHGGLRLAGRREVSTDASAEPVPIPATLILPLQQHIGTRAKPLVSVGDRVLKAQPIAEADGYVSAYLHAPTSGRVAAIKRLPVPHPSGLSARCIVIDTDGEETWWDQLPEPCSEYAALDAHELRTRIRSAGIVGLGGAAFPSAVKLNPGPDRKLDLLVLNGAECEPYITCDDVLMRTRAREVITGAAIMCRSLGIEHCVVGIEDDMPAAIGALEEAQSEFARDADIRVQPVPTVYPTGGEKQLLQVLTGREVPSDGIPADIGIVCHNVGTAAAVYDAIARGLPLMHRFVTVTGHGVRRPRNVEALLGTPVSHLIEHCGGYAPDVARLILGGPMMGFAASTDEVPIVKGTNCVLAATYDDITPVRTPVPCIRCGACAEVCPVTLLPQQLYWFARAKDFDKVQDYNLFDCIECGCCAAVCPSHIPLVQYYRYAKTEIWTQERERQKSDMARRRFDFRLERIEADQRAREERLQKKKKALDTAAGTEGKKAAIEAALQRVQEKKRAQAARGDKEDA